MMPVSMVAKIRTHRIVLGHEEEVDGTVQAGDIPVEADAQAKDNFPHGEF
jgi:hypothetical protein